MFSVRIEMSLSIAAASDLWATCSMPAMRQQRKSCYQFVDEVATWHSTQCRLCRNVGMVSVSPRCSPACVQEATCKLVNAICTGSSPLLVVTSATLEELESHDHAAWGPCQHMLRRAGLAEKLPVWKLKHSVTVVQTRQDKCLTSLTSRRGQVVYGRRRWWKHICTTLWWADGQTDGHNDDNTLA